MPRLFLALVMNMKFDMQAHWTLKLSSLAALFFDAICFVKCMIVYFPCRCSFMPTELYQLTR